METITGHRPEAFYEEARYGRHLIHPDDLDAYNAAIADLPNAGALTHSYRFKSADGEWLWFRDELQLTKERHNGAAEFVGCMIEISAEIDAQQALSRSQAVHKAIISTSRNGIVSINSDGVLMDFNPAAARMFGHAKEDVLGRPIAETMIPTHLRERYDEGFERFRTTGDSRLKDEAIETEAMHADGTSFPVELSFSQIEVDGEVQFVAEIKDLTERLEARQQRENLSQLLQDAIDSLPHGFSVSDADGVLLLCNNAFAEPYGRAASDLIGQTSRELVEKFVPKIASINGQRLIPGHIDVEDILARLDRASTAPIELHLTSGEWWLITRHPTSDGGTASLRTDVTPLKAAEDAVRESNAFIYRLLEACPVPFGMTRADDGLVMYESPASKELYQRNSELGAVFAVDHFVDPADRDIYLETLRSDKAVDNFSVRLRRADGSEFPAHLSARLIEFDGEEVIVFSSADLTRQHEIEAEMALQRDALHQSEKLSALGELLAGIAHELNNPLSVLVGQALLLRETIDDPAIKSRAEKIGNAADRCARIVKTFLAMARQEPAKARQVDLSEIIDAAVEFTGYALRGSNIEVQLRVQPSLPPVYADTAQLQQVLVNLIVNAQHALDDREGDRVLKIIASFRESNNEILLKVKDNGPGMPEHIRRRIFEPLFTTKDTSNGTGIGLTLCHRIVDSHGGKMKVESVEGVGTSFVLRFPVSQAGQSPEEAAEVASQPKADGRALVIDDEADVGELIAEILKREGYRVDVATTGVGAVERLAGDRYDIILSDLRMPGFDGRDLYQQLQDDSPDLIARLGFITGDTVSPKARDFLKATGRPFLEKPISPKDVRRLLARMAAAGST